MGLARNLANFKPSSAGLVEAGDIAAGAISVNTYTSSISVNKFQFGNAAPDNQPINTSFTLSEAEAPIGSYVVISQWLTSGNSAGRQYCYTFQRSLGNNAAAYLAGFVTDWYFSEAKFGLFYINDSADRTFHISHGTINFSTNSDFRQVRYHGYIKVTQ
jgi:hypothetical protein